MRLNRETCALHIFPFLLNNYSPLPELPGSKEANRLKFALPESTFLGVVSRIHTFWDTLLIKSVEE